MSAPLVTLPYHPDVQARWGGTPPEHCASLTSGELRVGAWCTGEFSGTGRDKPYATPFEGEVVEFGLDTRGGPPRTYVFFRGVIHSARGDVRGRFGVPVDQFVVVG